MTNNGVTVHTTAVFRSNPGMTTAVVQSPELRAVLTMLALRVERIARQRAPVDTGRLRNSITHRVYADVGGQAGIAEVGTDVEYAIYHEFGTSKLPALRFLGGALQAVAGVLGGSGGDAIAKQLFDYTTKAGVTRKATSAQIANWTRGSGGIM